MTGGEGRKRRGKKYGDGKERRERRRIANNRNTRGVRERGEREG